MLFGWDLGIDTRIILNLIFLLFPVTMSIDAYRRKQDRGVMILGSALFYFVLGFTLCFILMTPELAR